MKNHKFSMWKYIIPVYGVFYMLYNSFKNDKFARSVADNNTFQLGFVFVVHVYAFLYYLVFCYPC